MNPGHVDLPYWMQVFSFLASGIIAILTIIGIIIQLMKKPKLKFRLTREIFFRISDSYAESIFANGVMVSEIRGIFIDDMSFTLKKIDNPQKAFILRAAFYGEKVRGLQPISDFNWYSTSPLAYIPVLIPYRASYLLVQEAYEVAVKKAFAEFQNSVLEVQRTFREAPPPAEPEQKEQKLKELAEKTLAIVKDYSSRIMELVQMEAGEYELGAEISYKIRRFLFFNVKQSANSRISFKIDANVKEMLRAALLQMLQTISANLVFTQTNRIIAPEYAPIEIREL